MADLLDLIFVGSTDPDGDARRLTGGAALAAAGRVLGAGARVADVHRAILLCDGAGSRGPAGASLDARSLDELVRASRIHDRIGAALPVAQVGERSDGESRLPPVQEVPAPDVACLLFKSDVLKMAGTLDP